MLINKRYAYIHIGTPKTGTTALQKTLVSNLSVLKKAGYLYPKTGLWARGHSDAHHNLAYQLFNFPFFDPKHGTLEQLVSEIKMWDGHVIISSEILVGLYNNPTKLSLLKGVFDICGLDSIVIIYFRDLIEYAEKMYAEFVKNHFLTININKFFNHIIKYKKFILYDNWEFCFDYFEIIKKIAFVFGNENIICVKYKNQETIKSFSKIIGVELLNKNKEIIINKTDNPKTIEILRVVNKILVSSNLDDITRNALNQNISNKLKGLNEEYLFNINDKNIKILEDINCKVFSKI
jgi:hypothetical protein